MKPDEICEKIVEHSVLITGVREDVKAILENHLPHIEAELSGTKKRIDWIIGIILAGVTFPLLFILLKGL